MDIPGGRVDKCKIGDLNDVSVHELYQVRPCVFKLSFVELLPPHLALAVDGAIVSGDYDIGEIGSEDQAYESSAWSVPSSTVGRQWIDHRVFVYVLIISICCNEIG